jgi:hypothetical protein
MTTLPKLPNDIIIKILGERRKLKQIDNLPKYKEDHKKKFKDCLKEIFWIGDWVPRGIMEKMPPEIEDQMDVVGYDGPEFDEYEIQYINEHGFLEIYWDSPENYFINHIS